jgi:hypothetical protein
MAYDRSCLPPLAEKRRIMAEMKQLMALVDALEHQLAASPTAAENLSIKKAAPTSA